MGILNGKLQFLRSRRLILKMKTLSIISVIVMLSLRMYLKKHIVQSCSLSRGDFAQMVDIDLITLSNLLHPICFEALQFLLGKQLN